MRKFKQPLCGSEWEIIKHNCVFFMGVELTETTRRGLQQNAPDGLFNAEATTRNGPLPSNLSSPSVPEPSLNTLTSGINTALKSLGYHRQLRLHEVAQQHGAKGLSVDGTSYFWIFGLGLFGMPQTEEACVLLTS